MIDIRVSDDPASACAELLARSAAAGEHLTLTGGSTPGAAYERAAELVDDWSRATLWWGDERCVEPDDERSNYGLAKRTLLDRLPESGAPAVHRVRGERGPAQGADAYERELREAFGDGLPRLDLVLLGLGPDAHVASLFPGQPTLDATDQLVVGVERAGLEPYVPRVSLTLPVLNNAARVVFLVTGEEKAEAAERAFSGDPSRDAPGSLVRPTGGDMVVLLDSAAASGLPGRR